LYQELAGLVSLSNDHAALALVVERYAALQAADRALLLPVLGSLFDLPLTGALAAQAASLAIDALNVVRCACYVRDRDSSYMFSSYRD
jgi:hypothetical protein